MVNVYIDTCSLINLLTEDKGNILTDNLEFWIDNGCIKLFTHETIILEWNKHKENKRASFKASEAAKYKHTLEVSQKENFYVPQNLEPSTESLDKQITKIDKMLSEAFKLEASLATKAKSSERAIPPVKAPFHNKIDSMKDAYIIFSALEYFSENSLNFTFISDNKNEFADPADTNRKIHPQLIEDYQTLTVDYYKEIGRAINDFKNLFNISLIPEDKSQYSTGKIDEAISIDRSKPLLDQVMNYLDLMHNDIIYVPPRILINHYPFKTGNSNSISYSLFKAEFGNQFLIELFEKIESIKDGKILDDIQVVFPDVEDAEIKSKKILKYLTRDLIFTVSNRRGNKSINTRHIEGETCYCPICEFNRFNFIGSFKQLKDIAKDEREFLALAYANYHIGNYERAAIGMKTALNLATEKKLNTTAFILQFNLSKLSIFLSNHYYKNVPVEEMARELSEIIPDNLINQYARPENREILEFIEGNKFFNQAKERIYDLHYKIIDHYYDNLRGSWSSNSYVWSLKNQFAEIESFLNDNRIIYDRFTEFHTLCERVFEAMFASHAVKEIGGSRLDNFDDWTMTQMMLYGDADKFNKFYARYKLKKLAYAVTQDERGSFPKLLDNFFSGYEGLRDHFMEYCEQNNRNFWSYYNKIFSNAMTLFSITELAEEEKKYMSVKILTYLSNEDYIQKDNLKHFRRMIARIGKSFDTKTLIGFLWITIKNQKYHDEHCTESICDTLDSREEKLTISEDEFKILKAEFIKHNSEGAITKINKTLIHLHNIIDSSLFRTEIESTVNDYVRQNYEFDFYYRAAIFDVIQYSPHDFERVLKSVMPSSSRQSMESVFGRPGDRYDGVNDFINLCFKLDLDTSAENFTPVAQLGAYYNWLLDMDNFNYENFNPIWPGEYMTRHYLKKIAHSSKVREYLESYLKEEANSEIEKLYYNIFIRKPWDIR